VRPSNGRPVPTLQGKQWRRKGHISSKRKWYVVIVPVIVPIATGQASGLSPHHTGHAFQYTLNRRSAWLIDARCSVDFIVAGHTCKEKWIMSSTTLYRFSGLGLLIGGLFALIGALIQGVNDNPLGPVWVPTAVLLMIGEMLLLAGLPGMYARQADKTGTLGLVGFILFFFGALMQAGAGRVTDLFFLPWLLQNAPHLASAGPPTIGIYFLLAGLLSVVGGILLGIATIRAGIFSRIAAILLIIGAVVNFAGQFLGDGVPYIGTISYVLLFGALLWFGCTLLSDRRIQTAQSAPVGAERGVRA
jgi:hypothetical protein